MIANTKVASVTVVGSIVALFVWMQTSGDSGEGWDGPEGVEISTAEPMPVNRRGARPVPGAATTPRVSSTATPLSPAGKPRREIESPQGTVVGRFVNRVAIVRRIDGVQHIANRRVDIPDAADLKRVMIHIEHLKPIPPHPHLSQLPQLTPRAL